MAQIRQTFAGNLKRYRELRNMSQGDLAAKCGLNLQTISRLERGAIGTSFETIEKLAKALNIDETDLVFAGTPPKPVVVQSDPAGDEAKKIREEFRKLIWTMARAGVLPDPAKDMSQEEKAGLLRRLAPRKDRRTPRKK